MTDQVKDTSINVSDLANIVNIIDFAASKGIFVGPDIAFVGNLRNKIQNFVEAAAPKAETQTSNEVSNEANTSATEDGAAS